MKIIAAICFSLFCAVCHAQSRDTFDVFFPLNDARLSKAAKDHMDMLVFRDSLIHGQQFIILGYADYLGSEKYNETLSAKRAENVKSYLVTMGFTAKDISICIGKGKINRTDAGKEGFAPDRKVQIIIVPHLPAPVADTPKPPKSLAKATVADIDKLPVNATIALRHIFFVPGMDVIEPSSMPELERLYSMLAKFNSIRIRLEGHICCKGIQTPTGIASFGDDSDGMQMSVLRAKAVYSYLISKGIDSARLSYMGRGVSQPAVFPAVSQEDMEMNRRVEVRIIKK